MITSLNHRWATPGRLIGRGRMLDVALGAVHRYVGCGLHCICPRYAIAMTCVCVSRVHFLLLPLRPAVHR